MRSKKTKKSAGRIIYILLYFNTKFLTHIFNTNLFYYNKNFKESEFREKVRVKKFKNCVLKNTNFLA